MTAYLTGVQERMRRAELNSVEERARRRLTTVAAAAVLMLTFLGGGGWMLVRGDRDARRAALTRDVNDALNRATVLRARAVSEPAAAALFAQAREQAQRALALAQRDLVDDALKVKATRLQDELDAEEKDHRLVAALDAARLAQAETLSAENRFATERAVPLFREAFRAYGLAAGEGAAAAAAERIRQRPPAVREAVVAALDEWVDLADDSALKIDEPHAAWLRAVAAAAVPADEWTRAFRAALAEPDAAKRRESLEKLAAEVDVRKQLPRTLTRLASRIMGVDPAGTRTGRKHAFGKMALQLLRRAQRQYPEDFWINQELGVGLHDSSSNPRDQDEALRFLTAAVALRPESAGTRFNLGLALQQAGQMDEAVTCFKKAVELDPKFAPAHSNLGVALIDKGQVDEAVACFKKAVELGYEAARPGLAMAERAVAAGEKLADFLDGRYKPTSNEERLGLAEFCRLKKRNHATA